MNDLNIVLMYTTVSTQDEAELLAHKLIESKLAVCVNIMAPHLAIYSEGKDLKRSQEIALLIKIPEERYAFAYESIKGWHPYTVPAILSWPAEVNPAYGFWAYHQTSMHY